MNTTCLESAKSKEFCYPFSTSRKCTVGELDTLYGQGQTTTLDPESVLVLPTYKVGFPPALSTVQ